MSISSSVQAAETNEEGGDRWSPPGWLDVYKAQVMGVSNLSLDSPTNTQHKSLTLDTMQTEDGPIDMCLYGFASGGYEADENLDVIDTDRLRRIASQGIDDHGSHRGVAWRVLLGFLPPKRSEWAAIATRERHAYRSFVQELFAVPDEDLAGADLRGHHAKRRTAGRRSKRMYHSSRAPVFVKKVDSTKSKSSTSSMNGSARMRRTRSKRRNQDLLKKENQNPQQHSEDDPSNNPTTTAPPRANDSQQFTRNTNPETDNAPFHNSATGEDLTQQPPALIETISETEPKETTTVDDDDASTPAVVEENTILTPQKILQDDSNPIWQAMTVREQKILERLTKSNLTINQLVIKVDSADFNNFLENATLLDEIRKDVVRTHPDLYFFLEPEKNLGNRRYAALERILFVWAKLNKGVRYVQGMNEIAGTLYYVLANDFNEEWADEAEADTYILFNILMSEMRDVFVPDMDEDDTGIVGRIASMQNVLAIHDPEIRCYLDALGIDASFYAVRWLTTLLSREFLLPDTIRLWDSFMSATQKENFLRYVCVTMVLNIRDQLLQGDFSVCLEMLQRYPPTNIDFLLESSQALLSYESKIKNMCDEGMTLVQGLSTIPPPEAIIMAFGLPNGVLLNKREKLGKAAANAKQKAKESAKAAREKVSEASQDFLGGAKRFLVGLRKRAQSGGDATEIHDEDDKSLPSVSTLE